MVIDFNKYLEKEYRPAAPVIPERDRLDFSKYLKKEIPVIEPVIEPEEEKLLDVSPISLKMYGTEEPTLGKPTIPTDVPLADLAKLEWTPPGAVIPPAKDTRPLAVRLFGKTTPEEYREFEEELKKHPLHTTLTSIQQGLKFPVALTFAQPLVVNALAKIAIEVPEFGGWLIKNRKFLSPLLKYSAEGAIAGAAAKRPGETMAKSAVEGAVWNSAFHVVYDTVPPAIKMLLTKKYGETIPPRVRVGGPLMVPPKPPVKPPVTIPAIPPPKPPVKPPVSAGVSRETLPDVSKERLVELGYDQRQISRLTPNSTDKIIEKSIRAENVSILPDGQIRQITPTAPEGEPIADARPLSETIMRPEEPYPDTTEDRTREITAIDEALQLTDNERMGQGLPDPKTLEVRKQGLIEIESEALRPIEEYMPPIEDIPKELEFERQFERELYARAVSQDDLYALIKSAGGVRRFKKDIKGIEPWQSEYNELVPRHLRTKRPEASAPDEMVEYLHNLRPDLIPEPTMDALEKALSSTKRNRRKYMIKEEGMKFGQVGELEQDLFGKDYIPKTTLKKAPEKTRIEPAVVPAPEVPAKVEIPKDRPEQRALIKEKSEEFGLKPEETKDILAYYEANSMNELLEHIDRLLVRGEPNPIFAGKKWTWEELKRYREQFGPVKVKEPAEQLELTPETLPAEEIKIKPEPAPLKRIPKVEYKPLVEVTAKKETLMLVPGTKITSDNDIANIFTEIVQNAPREKMFVICLKKGKVTHIEVNSIGDVDQAVVYPRAIAQTGVVVGADEIWLCHNHPSGQTRPSDFDIEITKKAKSAIEAAGMKYGGHTIVNKITYGHITTDMTGRGNIKLERIPLEKKKPLISLTKKGSYGAKITSPQMVYNAIKPMVSNRPTIMICNMSSGNDIMGSTIIPYTRDNLNEIVPTAIRAALKSNSVRAAIITNINTQRGRGVDFMNELSEAMGKADIELLDIISTNDALRKDAPFYSAKEHRTLPKVIAEPKEYFISEPGKKRLDEVVKFLNKYKDDFRLADIKESERKIIFKLFADAWGANIGYLNVINVGQAKDHLSILVAAENRPIEARAESEVPAEVTDKTAAQEEALQDADTSVEPIDSEAAEDEMARNKLLEYLKRIGKFAPEDILTKGQIGFAHMLKEKRRLTDRQYKRIMKLMTELPTMEIYTKTGRLKKKIMSKAKARAFINLLQRVFVRPYKPPRIPRAIRRRPQLKGLLRAPIWFEGEQIELTRQEVAEMIKHGRRVFAEAGKRFDFAHAAEFFAWAQGGIPQPRLAYWGTSRRYFFQQFENDTGYPVYTAMYLPMEENRQFLLAHTRKYEGILKDISGDLIKPTEENINTRIRVQHILEDDIAYFENDVPPTDEELYIADRLRKEFYGDVPGAELHGIYKIPGWRDAYGPWVREQGGIQKAHRRGLPKELHFFAELEREGSMHPDEWDFLKLANIYLHRGARKHFLQPIIKVSRNLRSILPPGHRMRKPIEDYVNNVVYYIPPEIQAEAEASARAIVESKPMKQIFDHLGVRIFDDPNKNEKILNEMSSLYFTSLYSGALAGRAHPVIRNAFQSVLMGIPEFGPYWWGRGKARTHSPGGMSKWREKGVLKNWGLPFQEEIDRQLELGKMVDTYVKMAKLGMRGYTLMDDINRSDMANALEARFDHFYEQLRRGEIDNERFEKRINLDGFDPQLADLVRGRIGAGDIEGAKRIMILDTVDGTQWPYRRGTAMPILEKGKFISAFYIWPTEYAQSIYYRWIKRKQWKKLARWAAVGAATKLTGRALGLNLDRWVHLGPLSANLNPPLAILYALATIVVGAGWKNRKKIREGIRMIENTLPIFIGYGLAARGGLRYEKNKKNNYEVYDNQGKYMYTLTPEENFFGYALGLPLHKVAERRKLSNKFYNLQDKGRELRAEIARLVRTGKEYKADKKYDEFIDWYERKYQPIYDKMYERYAEDFIKRNGRFPARLSMDFPEVRGIIPGGR